MKCKYCHQSDVLKKGKRKQIQRYFCKNCSRYFQDSYLYRAYSEDTNDLIISLLKEGCSVRGISRVVKITTKTVLSRMLEISKQIKIPYFDKLGCKFEVDDTSTSSVQVYGVLLVIKWTYYIRLDIISLRL